MLEPPHLADEMIVTALEAAYGIDVAALAFLPIGSDSTAWVYRVEGRLGGTYLLKVRARVSDARGLALPRYLHEHGVPHIVPPLVTGTGTLSVEANGFALSLSPYIDGRTGASARLRANQWHTLGAVLKRIHMLPLTPGMTRIAGRETFTPSRRNVIDELEAAVATQVAPDPVAREFAALWHARHGQIRALVDRSDALGQKVARASGAMVLCHADLHTWNVLIDAEEQLWIVDWDEAILAPRERDLMFVVGGIVSGLVSPEDTASFFRGYGETIIDSRALAYYRYAWAVQDLAAYGESVLLLPDLGEKTRRAAVEGFLDLFEPGNIVEQALSADDSSGNAGQVTAEGAGSRRPRG